MCMQVWVYDSRLIGRNACCESKLPFQTLYPSSPPSEEQSSSTSTPSQVESSSVTPRSPSLGIGGIDAVFYSYHHRRMFVFAGDQVYENVAYDERAPGVNLLRPLAAWYDVWFDICDVE